MPDQGLQDKATPKPRSFETEISWFLEQLGSFQTMLPTFAKMGTELYRRVSADLKAFVVRHGVNIVYDEDGDLAGYSVPAEFANRHRDLRSVRRNVIIFTSKLPPMTIVTLISLFDAYFGRLVRQMFELKPELLTSSDRALNFAQISKFQSIADARAWVVEKEIDSLLRDSHENQFAWLSKKVGPTAEADPRLWPCFIELTERRNLFVHCDGVVNEQYRNVCRKAGVSATDLAEIGEKLDVSKEYFERACNCLEELAIKLGQLMWRKLQSDDLNAADYWFIKESYRLLKLEQYELAEQVLRFSMQDAFRSASHENKMYMNMNLAIALKGQDKHSECMDLLNSIDFSAMIPLFRLAEASLREDFATAAALMKQIGVGDGVVPGKRDYQDWPLFRWLRHSDEFKEAYKAIYDEDYVPFVLQDVDLNNGDEGGTSEN